MDCTISVTTSRSTRPVSSATRETGVTRYRSMIPARHSEMIANPTNVEPNRASWISSPGTKNRYASAVPPDPDPPDSVPAGQLGEQRAEQRQVEDRLQHADDEERGHPQDQPLLAAEDEQRVA